MKKPVSFVVVLVTTPNLKSARQLAKAALEERLVACANLVPGIESHYWWQAKLERGSEVLILFKTRTGHLPKLENLIMARHPYDTPEFLVLPIKRGNRRYLEWLDQACDG